MIETKLWAINLVMGGVVVVLWWGVKMFASNLTSNITKLTDAINKLEQSNTRQTELINNNTEHLKNADTRLNDHAERIRSLEYKQASCRNFKTNRDETTV
jgi:predicted PurR-regulated permease PerM